MVVFASRWYELKEEDFRRENAVEMVIFCLNSLRFRELPDGCMQKKKNCSLPSTHLTTEALELEAENR